MKILIINGHPFKESFSRALAESYFNGAKKEGHEVKIVHLGELKFDPVLRFGYAKRMKVEKDLEPQQELIKWCEHLVIITPVWWMGASSLLKGYFERVLTPDFAYNHKKRFFKFIPNRLLKGRSARVIYTQDGPSFIYRTILLDCFWRSLKLGVLWYVGFSPVRRTYFTGVTESSGKKRGRWLRKVEKLGQKGK